MRKLRFAGRLSRLAGGGWQLEGELGATVIQTCVVTLDPLTTRIDQPVRRTFLPQADATGPELVISPDEDDEIEPLARADRPRAGGDRGPGAGAAGLSAQARRELRRPRSGLGDEESEAKPFAALAALRGKIGSGS